MADQPQKKCYVRTYHYDDGTSRTFHTECDGWKIPLESDKFGRELEPEKKLIEVVDVVHFL